MSPLRTDGKLFKRGIMTQRIFGTDGLRGRVGSFPMQPETALRLGLAAGQYFRNGKKRHKVLIGKDTRISGYIFESALTSGFCAVWSPKTACAPPSSPIRCLREKTRVITPPP